MEEKDIKIDESTLIDFFINSVDEKQEPIWTYKHISELLYNFDVVSKANTNKLYEAYKQDEKVIQEMAKYFEGYEINDLITLNSQKEAINYFRKKCE